MYILCLLGKREAGECDYEQSGRDMERRHQRQEAPITGDSGAGKHKSEYPSQLQGRAEHCPF